MEKIKNLIDTVDLSFIGSVDDKGFPNIRAMLKPRQYDKNLNSIYFSTNTDIHKINQFLKNNKACIYFCNQNTFTGALLVGRMEVLDTIVKSRKNYGYLVMRYIIL